MKKSNCVYVRMFVLALLSFLVDVFVFRRELSQQFALYSEFHSTFIALIRLGVHSLISVCVATAFYGLVRSVPKIGLFIQWGIYFLVNVSYHLFYVIQNRMPNSQDLRTLIMTPIEMSTGTILSTLSFSAIVKAVSPVILVFAAYVFVSRFLANKNILRPVVANVTAFLAVLVYVFNPMDISLVVLDTFTNTEHLLASYVHEAKYYDIERLNYTPPNQQQSRVIISC